MTLMKQSVINFICQINPNLPPSKVSLRKQMIENKRIKLITVKYTIGAYVIYMRHLKEIKRGDLEFFNKGSK